MCTTNSPAAEPPPEMTAAEPPPRTTTAQPWPAGLDGRSPAVQRLRHDAERAARVQAPLVLVGESGTGKERLARAVHARAAGAGPLVVIGPGSLQEPLAAAQLFGHVRGAFTGALDDRPGLLEAAHGGAVLLDDPTALPPAAQALLLRALDEGRVRPVGGAATRPFQARLLVTSTRPLEEAVRAGQLRDDLRWRLQGLELRLPPLRERPEDLPDLLEALTRERAAPGQEPPAVSPAALEALQAHAWPGNVRELENEVRRWLGLRLTRVRRRDLALQAPPRALLPSPGAGLDEALLELERDLVGRALSESRGNVAEAARRLGVERTRLLRRLPRLGLRAVRGPDGAGG